MILQKSELELFKRKEITLLNLTFNYSLVLSFIGLFFFYLFFFLLLLFISLLQIFFFLRLFFFWGGGYFFVYLFLNDISLLFATSLSLFMCHMRIRIYSFRIETYDEGDEKRFEINMRSKIAKLDRTKAKN